VKLLLSFVPASCNLSDSTERLSNACDSLMPGPVGSQRAGNQWNRGASDRSSTDRVLDEESLHVPPPYTSGWVSQILSVSADGSGAVCVVGLTPGSQMTYFVYELSFNDGLGRKVAELPQVFL
jgi:hypothetical protein